MYDAAMVLLSARKRDELDEWCRDNWNKLPEEKRRACIDRLRAYFEPRTIELMRAQHQAGFRIGSHMLNFHFTLGMSVRNRLREVVPDDALPQVKQADGSLARNWDDFYMGALEQLAEEAS